MVLHPRFLQHLPAARLAELDDSPHTVLGLFPDDTAGYSNRAWGRFAVANGAPELVGWAGGAFSAAVAAPLRPFFARLFATVRQTGAARSHDYECSSPTHFRRFRLWVVPLDGGALLLEHHLRVELPHERPAARAVEVDYRDEYGVLTLCCHCRNTRRRDRQTWDWVPGFLDRELASVSHGLCPRCFHHHYPEAAEDDGEAA